MTSFSHYTTHKHGVAMGKVAIGWGQAIVWFSWCSCLSGPSSEIVLPKHYMDNIYSGASVLHMGGKTPPSPQPPPYDSGSPNHVPSHSSAPAFLLSWIHPCIMLLTVRNAKSTGGIHMWLPQGATHECQVEGLYLFCFSFLWSFGGFGYP